MIPKEKLPPPRLLVVAGYPPEGGGGGGVILRSLLKDYPAERLMWLAVRPDRTKRKGWYRPDIRKWIIPLYLPTTVARMIGPKLCRVYAQLHEHFALLIIRWAIRRHRPSDLLVIADISMINIGRKLADGVLLRFHLTVHDDPLVAAALAGGSTDAHQLGRNFAILCRRASSIDCVSARMAAKYRQEYQVKPLVLTRGAEDQSLAKAAERQRRPAPAELNMILAGWGDCPPPWPDNLIAALESVRLTKKINLHAFDPRFRQYERFDWVHFHRHLPEHEFDLLLERMDFSYAPDPLTEEGRRFAASSLSTKVVTSICAGIPFLYHGPAESTVGDLLREEPLLGVLVESQLPADIAQGIIAVSRHHSARAAACHAFAQKHFSAVRIRERFLSRFA